MKKMHTTRRYKVRKFRLALVIAVACVVLSLLGFLIVQGVQWLRPGPTEETFHENSSEVSSEESSSEEVSSEVSSEPESSQPVSSQPVSSAPVSSGGSSQTVSSTPSVTLTGDKTFPGMYNGIKWRSPVAKKYSLKYGRELLLINNYYELDETFEFNLVSFSNGAPITQSQLVHRDDNGFVYTVWMDQIAYQPMKDMMAAAKADGVPLTICSAYRSIKLQDSLFNEYVVKYGSVEKANTMRTYAGTSEHNTGLGFDLCMVDQSFANTKEFRWLQEHAEEYGFILRYTAEKQSITGIIYEPWHYRYVGVEHAKKINELGMCLEEYIDYLGGLE